MLLMSFTIIVASKERAIEINGIEFTHSFYYRPVNVDSKFGNAYISYSLIWKFEERFMAFCDDLKIISNDLDTFIITSERLVSEVVTDRENLGKAFQEAVQRRNVINLKEFKTLFDLCNAEMSGEAITCGSHYLRGGVTAVEGVNVEVEDNFTFMMDAAVKKGSVLYHGVLFNIEF